MSGWIWPVVQQHSSLLIWLSIALPVKYNKHGGFRHVRWHLSGYLGQCSWFCIHSWICCGILLLLFWQRGCPANTKFVHGTSLWLRRRSSESIRWQSQSHMLQIRPSFGEFWNLICIIWFPNMTYKISLLRSQLYPRLWVQQYLQLRLRIARRKALPKLLSSVITCSHLLDLVSATTSQGNVSTELILPRQLPTNAEECVYRLW